MYIEIEKKFELTQSDYETIKSKCKFMDNQELKDYYLDDSKLSLLKHNFFLRMRNGQYELKIISQQNNTFTGKEYNDEEEINKQMQVFDINIDDTSGILFVDTKREKYNYEYKGYNFCIDIDRYQYGSRYEIELIFESENHADAGSLIDEFRNHIGLTAPGGIESLKIITCAMHQNIEAYELLTQNENLL